VGAGGSREAVRRGATDRTDSHTGHIHTLEIVGAPNHTHPLSIVSNGAHTHTVSIVSNGAHTHTVSIVSNGAHTHTVTVGSAGGGSAHENRPPYYALAFIMRIS
jgi:microcystin-dependent protein